MHRFALSFPSFIFVVLVSMAVTLFGHQTTSRAAEPTIAEIMNAVVEVHAEIRSDARTLETLGPTRTGSGVLIGKDGLVLTIGYVIMEAKRLTVRSREGVSVEADAVAYDHESGLGLVRAKRPLGVNPLEIGDSGVLKEK